MERLDEGIALEEHIALGTIAAEVYKLDCLEFYISLAYIFKSPKWYKSKLWTGPKKSIKPYRINQDPEREGLISEYIEVYSNRAMISNLKTRAIIFEKAIRMTPRPNDIYFIAVLQQDTKGLQLINSWQINEEAVGEGALNASTICNKSSTAVNA